MYLVPGKIICEPCQAGYYQDGHDAEQCFPCGMGSVPTVDKVSCELCPPGTHAPDDGTTTCIPCLPGMYTSNTGSSHCNNCPAGKMVCI